MQIDEILSRLDRVKRGSRGWYCICPSHHDRNRSLSVREIDGKILIKCFAGCDIRDIVSDLGIEMKDLFEESAKNGISAEQAVPRRRIAEIYEYTDEKENLLFQSIRYEPKGFAQRKPDDNGGFIYSLENTRQVIYRLPEVMVADMVFIVEGEKDVEAIREFGFTATCNPLGALKWKDEYNRVFEGKTAIIIPDNDEPGRRHALQVATSLYSIAREIVILELPDLKPKEDVSDFFEAGGSIDEIIGLIERAESWHPNGIEHHEIKDVLDFESCLSVKPLNEYIDEAKSRPIPKRLFGDLWLEGELCIAFGETGKGKTILAVQAGESIATGQSISPFKLEAEPQVVMYLDFELSDKQFEGRYSEKNLDDKFHVNHYRFSQNFLRAVINPYCEKVSRFRTFEEYLNFSIECQIEKSNAKILIVDNITWLRSETEKAKDALPLMKELNNLKKKFHLSILALAHTPKRDSSKPLTVKDLQGSAMLSNFADSIFAIGASSKDERLRYIKQIKSRSTELIYGDENVCVFRIEKPSNFLQFEFLEYETERNHLKIYFEDGDELVSLVKSLAAEGYSYRTISNMKGISPSTVCRYLKK
jgi:hypothetical protein